jgi:phage terminase small subunit
MEYKTTLSERQRIYCERYVINGKLTQSALDAGYAVSSAATQANQLMKNPNVQEHITKLKEERNKRVNIDSDWVLKKAVIVFDRCMEEKTSDPQHALKALELVGKHVNVKAFDNSIKVGGDAENPLRVQLDATDRAKRIADILKQAMESRDAK